MEIFSFSLPIEYIYGRNLQGRVDSRAENLSVLFISLFSFFQERMNAKGNLSEAFPLIRSFGSNKRPFTVSRRVASGKMMEVNGV
jgi:hypothetical protein